MSKAKPPMDVQTARPYLSALFFITWTDHFNAAPEAAARCWVSSVNLADDHYRVHTVDKAAYAIPHQWATDYRRATHARRLEIEAKLAKMMGGA